MIGAFVQFRSASRPTDFVGWVVAENGCWLWTGARNETGYGYSSLVVNGVKVGSTAHRAVYTELVGPIPVGMQLDHLCRNPSCVNPAHLEPVTPRENVMRSASVSAENARRTHCSYGHPFSEDNTILKQVRGGVERMCAICYRRRTKEANRRWIAKAARTIPNLPTQVLEERLSLYRVKLESAAKHSRPRLIRAIKNLERELAGRVAHRCRYTQQSGEAA